MFTKQQVEAMTGPELIAAYNKLSPDAPVKRFAARAAGVRRVLGLIAKLPAAPTPASNATRSEAIARSWADVKVRAARAARHPVEVNGKQFKSVSAAWRDLAIEPDHFNRHIRFRGELVAKGRAEYVNDAGKKFTFTTVGA